MAGCDDREGSVCEVGSVAGSWFARIGPTWVGTRRFVATCRTQPSPSWADVRRSVAQARHGGQPRPEHAAVYLAQLDRLILGCQVPVH
jgi:hypothetical protein